MEASEKHILDPPTSSESSKSTKDIDNVAPNRLVDVDTAETNPLEENIDDDPGLQLHRAGTFHFRAVEDEEPQDWWFASTAIPLIAATSGPLANVCSIAALITSWRNNVVSTGVNYQADSVGYPDPHWCIALNIASLVCGCIGNVFLLFNFTKAVRYIVALPATIVCWYFATGILIGATASMNHYVPPGPNQVYSQGFWYAIIAACTYLFSSMLLMVNMLGYFLGHYPQHFALTDDQRNLILQTTMFFIWLGGGGGVFSVVCDWSFADALYFCDVTILTVGFGDYTPSNDVGRGLVFPYSVFGIIILGLMVSSIHSFANDLSRDKVIKHHVERRRVLTMDRTVSSSIELERREQEELEKHLAHKRRLTISAPTNMRRATTIQVPTSRREPTVTFDEPSSPPGKEHQHTNGPIHMLGKGIKRVATFNQLPNKPKKSKLLLMREEKDRFEAMRNIQYQTNRFKRWYALSISVMAFGILWCVGAIGFWKAEKSTQDMTYFESLYFCYVSLLTIGYGDLSPKSNAGKPYFIIWSLIAVPTMTILISDMGDTIISSIKHGTFILADWTVMPKKGLYRSFLNNNPWLWKWIQKKVEKKRVKEGFATGLDEENIPVPTLEELADLSDATDQDRARRLAIAIRKTANDLTAGHRKRYSYEEWVEFTRLIRFTAESRQEIEDTEEVEGIVEWDWIGENSPMLAEISEPEWVLDRLCESLNRYLFSDPRDKALRAERRQSEIGNVGSDQGDEPPLMMKEPDYAPGPAGPKPKIRRRSLSTNSSSISSVFDPRDPTEDPVRNPEGWDPLRGRQLASPAISPGMLSPDSENDRRLSAEPGTWDARERGRSFSARRISGELTEQEVSELSGPDRRRYRRFSSIGR